MQRSTANARAGWFPSAKDWLAALAGGSVGAALALTWAVGVFSPQSYEGWASPLFGAIARGAQLWFDTWFVFVYAVIVGTVTFSALRNRKMGVASSAAITTIAAGLTAGALTWAVTAISGNGPIGVFLGLEMGAYVTAITLPMTFLSPWMARHPVLAGAIVATTLALLIWSSTIS